MSTKFDQGLDVAGNVSLTGNIVVGGNTITGDSDTDSITFNADINSDMIPDADGIYDIGTLTKRWGNIYGSTLTIDTSMSAGSLVVAGSVTADQFISTSTGTPTLTSASDINIAPAGQVNVTSDMEVTGNLLVQGILSNLTEWAITEVNGKIYFQHNGVNKMSLDSSGNMVITGDFTAFGTIT